MVLPREATGPLVLEPGPPHALRVAVRDRGTGRPVAGARVTVLEDVRLQQASAYAALLPGPPLLVTDAAGEVVVPDLAGTERLVVAAEADGYPPPRPRPGPCPARGPPVADRAPPEAVVLLTAARTVRWPIVAGAYPVPPDGTRVSILVWSGADREWTPHPEEGVVQGGDLVVGDCGEEAPHGYAIAPDGSAAEFHTPPGAAEGPPITFHPQRTIEVRLRFEDGSPPRAGGSRPATPAVGRSRPWSRPTRRAWRGWSACTAVRRRS